MGSMFVLYLHSILHKFPGKISKGKPVIISATGKESCPVKMLLDYLKLTSTVDTSNEFIFRNILWCKKEEKYQ